MNKLSVKPIVKITVYCINEKRAIRLLEIQILDSIRLSIGSSREAFQNSYAIP